DISLRIKKHLENIRPARSPRHFPGVHSMMLGAKAPNYDTCGSQSLTPTYEQAHVCRPFDPDIILFFYLLFLSVISIGSMFSVIMFILEFLWRRLYSGIDHLASCCHLGYFFQHYCIVDCLMAVFSPGKGTM